MPFAITRHLSSYRRRKHSLAAAAIVASLTLLPNIPAQAACNGGTECLEAQGQSRLNTWMDFDAADGRVGDKEWNQHDWSAVPLTVVPTGSGATVNTSLRHWRAHSDNRSKSKMEEVKKLAPDGLVLPKSVPSEAVNFDVWSKLTTDDLSPAESHSAGGTVGFEYNMKRYGLVGLAATQDTTTSSDGAPTNESVMLSPYLSLRPSRNISWTTSANWGSENWQSDADRMAAHQRVLSTSLRAGWQLGAFDLTPMVAVTHGVSDLQTDAANEQLSSTKFKMAPRISRKFHLDDAHTIEPFAQYENEQAIDSLTTAGETEAIGAGFTFGKDADYKLGVSSEMERKSTTEETDVKGRIELKVPLQ
jgi:hypothetical protein